MALKVGVLTDSLSRNAGGLFESVRHLSKEMDSDEVEIQILGLEDEWTETDMYAWQGCDVRVCKPKGPLSLGYSSEMSHLLEAADLDLVHLHGIWKFSSVAANRWGQRNAAPVIVSPRGMLDSWALKQSRVKKKIAGWLYQHRCLKEASCIHALCDEEYTEIRKLGYTNPVAVIPNGTTIPEEYLGRGVDVQNASNDLLFLGRLDAKKGLASLIEAWALLSSKNALGSWVLKVAGWGAPEYVESLKTQVMKYGCDSTVKFLGPVYGDEKAALLRNSTAFVLPSYSEGLPMAVLEAWSYGLPVLMTRHCNLSIGFERQAALEISTDADQLALTLGEFLASGRETQQRIGENGRRLVKEHFSWTNISQQMIAVYRWLVDEDVKPPTVRL